MTGAQAVNALGAIIVGTAITVLAVVLNVAAGSVVGASLAFVSMVLAYIVGFFGATELGRAGVITLVTLAFVSWAAGAAAIVLAIIGIA